MIDIGARSFMLVRVGSMQTNDEFWINPDHVISIRIQKNAGTATVKLSDGTTHNVKIRSDAPAIEADALKLLHGRSTSRLTDLLAAGANGEEQRFGRRAAAPQR